MPIPSLAELLAQDPELEARLKEAGKWRRYALGETGAQPEASGRSWGWKRDKPEAEDSEG